MSCSDLWAGIRQTAAGMMVADLRGQGIAEVKILGVDFDYTLTTEDSYPCVAPFRAGAIEALKRFQARGGKIILKTCREGRELDTALRALGAAGVVPDAVNQNIADFALSQGIRKIYVDLDIDDRALGCPLDWLLIGQVLDALGPQVNPSKGES